VTSGGIEEAVDGGEPPRLRRSLRRQALRIVAIYACTAGAWIAVSDRLLGAVVSDADDVLRLSIIKGIAFVAVTAGVLYAMLRSSFATIERSFVALRREQAERVLRNKAEAVAEGERRFVQSLVEALPGVFYLYDERGTFLRWNRNFESVTGYSADEIAAMHPLDLFGGADRAVVEARIAEVFAGTATSVEASLVAKSGAATPYYFTGRQIELGGKTCLVGVGLDVTDRRVAETELRRSEERYRGMLDSMLEGCQILDFDWRYLYLNDAAAVQNRRANVELLGHRMPDVWPGIEQSEVFAMMRRTMTERVALEAETEFAFPDGSAAWFDVRVRPVPEGIFVLSIDISKRKRAERALVEINEGLERTIALRTCELDAARLRAEAADRTKSAFLATMSHELRTPLNSIIGFTGIMLQGLAGPLVDEQKKQLGMVQNSARHLLVLINDVLDISKIEAGQLEVSFAELDLHRSIERVVGSLEPLAKKKGLTLEVVAPTGGLVVETDQRRIEQILINLLNNAIKFTHSGGVTLTVESDGPRAELRMIVADTGIGIRPEDLGQLFQAFRQVDTGLQRQHDGTGLGLAICRRLAELLGGTIAAESTWGRGSRFILTIPTRRGAP
jgi:PAS domain S-box-containing protein